MLIPAKPTLILYKKSLFYFKILKKYLKLTIISISEYFIRGYLNITVSGNIIIKVYLTLLSESKNI